MQHLPTEFPRGPILLPFMLAMCGVGGFSLLLGVALGADASEEVRSWEDAQRAVLRGAVVEVDSHGEHLRQHRGGGLGVDDACLHGPRPEAGDLAPLADRDDEVLVPCDLPVRRGRLVEEDPPHGDAGRAKHGFDEGSDGGGGGEPPHFGDLGEKIPSRVRLAPRSRERRGQAEDGRAIEQAVDDREPITREGHLDSQESGRAKTIHEASRIYTNGGGIRVHSWIIET